jgi:nucleotide-binding universal stress UspA family protein
LPDQTSVSSERPPDGDPPTDGRPRVVVGVDGSPASEAALERAAEEARLRHAVLHVVHAWQYPFDLTAASYTAVPVPAGEMEQWAEQVIDDALASAGVDQSLAVVRQATNGSAALVLAEASRGAQLLVVGTRGHNRLTGLFLGSVSQYLAVHAPCPVLVVHGPGDGAASGAATAPAASDAPAPVAPGATGAPGSPELLEIPEDECLALLAGRRVGRLVVVRDGMPQAYPVNYVLDGRTVALRTDPGLLLDWATLGQVAFEVDQIDEDSHEGWSVVVHGVGRDVTDGVDAWSERVRSRPLEPWAGGDRRHWVAIAGAQFTGRRLVRHESRHDDLARA